MQPKRKGKRTTKVNNQLESKGGNHVYARRKLNPKSTTISDRTLRSASKTPVKTGTPSLSRCSEPHISRGRSSSSAPEEIQEPDVPTAQAINMSYQVTGEVSGQIQPPRYLVSDPVAHPPTMEQELGQKEARNVENSTVDVPERMEEEDKAENSLSIHSKTEYSPQALSLKPTEPELRQKEARNVENSTVNVSEMMEEENKDESSHSRTGCSPQALSPKLTEPELGQKEARNVENSTVDASERMEEEDKAENSLSNHLKTGCSPQALSLKPTEPELGQNEARNVKNSTADVPKMMEEEDKDENSLSSHLWSGCSPQALGLKLIEPDLGQKEARNVENSPVDVAEMMDEEDKDENSLSIHSREGCSPRALSLKLIEPELGQKEARNVENSTVDVPLPEMMEEEDKDENSLSNHSGTGCSPPAHSQRLTELAAMAREDDDDEIDSEVQSRTEDSVNEYMVKHMPILRKIIGKRGDIAKNCPTKSVRFRSALLGMICEIISELENKDFTNIKIKDLETMISEVDVVKELNVEVQWLHSRLTNILEAKRAFKQTGKLKEKIDIKRKSVDIAESAVEDCEAEIKNLEGQIKKFEDQKALWKVKLAKSRDEFTRTYNETISATAKINRFRNSSLVDGLL